MRRLGGVSLLAVILSALLGVTSAGAATTYGNAGEFGSGDLATLGGIAVDSGNVLVVDPGSNRVRVYDPAGSSAALLTSFGAGRLTAPEDIAVDQSNGAVYVTSPGAAETQTVRISNAAGGTFILGFEGQKTAPIPYGSSAAAAQAALEALSTIGVGNVKVEGGYEFRTLTFTGELAEADPQQLTIDGSGLVVATPEAGPVQAAVEPTRDGKIVKFIPDNRTSPTSYAADPSFDSPAHGSDAAQGQIGSFVASPIAVDPTTGDLLIGDNGNRWLDRFSSSGEFLGGFSGVGSPGGPFTSFLDLAVIPSGQIYVIRDGIARRGGAQGSKVERFAADGSDGTLIEGSQLGSAYSLAFDPSLGNLIVATGGFSIAPEVPQLSVYHDGALVEQVPYPHLTYLMPRGLAVDSDQSGRLYVGVYRDEGQGPSSVQVFSPLAIPTLAPPSPVKAIGSGQATAHLSGSLEPMGRQAKYHFEYSADGGASWIATPEEEVGGGAATVQVAADVTLPIETSYRLRLVIASYGARVASPPLTFLTPRIPFAETGRADHISTSSATLRGLLSPRGTASSYRFEYGTSVDYGSMSPLVTLPLPAGASYAALPAEQTLTGLQPDTTYHYRLVAESIVGMAVGKDASFTTPLVTSLRAVSPTIPSSAVDGSPPGPRPKRCRKGRHLRTAHGKSRCVKAHKQRRRHRA